MRISLVLMTVLAMSACCSGAALGAGPAWTADERLGFHFALFDAKEHAPGDAWKTVPVAQVSPNPAPGAADITNIDLDGIRGLGFPLPARPGPGSFTFFLKFFEFPEWLSAEAAAKRVVDAYGLHLLPGGAELGAWLSDRGHLRVKKGVVAPTGQLFSAAVPYPDLVVPQKDVTVDGTTLTPQQYFDRSVPFVSLYLEPAEAEPAGISENGRVAWSGKGVLAFHQALLDAYSKNYTTRNGPDPDKYRYFQVPTASGTVTILKLPAKPMSFEANWRDLPMPENPDKVFLSSLLLIYRYEYIVTGDLGADAAVDSPEFAAATRLLNAQVFEAGSVARQP